MNQTAIESAQTATLKAIAAKYPALYNQAVKQLTGFGQSGSSSGSTFDSIMSGITNLATAYGQYQIASNVTNAQLSANRGTLSPIVSSGSTNWLLIGGAVLLLGVVVFAVAKKRKRS